MQKKVFLRIIISIGCALGMIVLTSGNLIAAEKLRMKIVSTSDREMTLVAPISGNWEFLISDFTIAIRPEAIRRIERTPDAKFKITLNSGDILEASQEKKGEISGEGEWGETQLSWNKVKYVEIVLADKRLSEKPADKDKKIPQWRVLSLSGLSVDLWDVQWGYKWEFNLQGFIIEVATDRLKSTEQLPETGEFRLTFEDGKSFVGTSIIADASITGQGPWGKVSIPSSKVSKIIRIGKIEQTERPTTAGPSSKIKIAIESNSGMSLEAWDVEPSNLLEFAGMLVEAIHWENIRTISGEEDGFRLQDKEGFAITLKKEGEGRLSGKTSIGEFYIPLNLIHQIQVSKSMPSDKAPPVILVAKVAFSGYSVDASEVNIEGEVDSDTSWLEGFMELTRNGLHYWVKKELILSKGFHTEHDRFYTDISVGFEDFDKPENKITFKTSIASLRGDLSSIDQLVPTIAPTAPPPKPEGATRVRIFHPNGQEQRFDARKIWFVNYPRTCWTGSYYAWPFRWWREEYIEVIRDDDASRIRIKIDKLASIGVVGESYSRKLAFESLAGGKLLATHFWDDLNGDTKHGPASWDREKEGVLLDLKDGLYVFVPFVAIRQILFAWP